MVTWGSGEDGGDSSWVQEELQKLWTKRCWKIQVRSVSPSVVPQCDILKLKTWPLLGRNTRTLVTGWQQDGGPPAYWWVDHYPHLAAKNLGMVRELNDLKGGGFSGQTFPPTLVLQWTKSPCWMSCLFTLVHDLYICPGKTVFHGLSFHVHGWKESMTSLSVTVDTE